MKLFEPGKIGTMQVKNRIVMAPIGVGRMAEADGDWGERVREYYIARAHGGTGLITTAFVFVTQELEPIAKANLNLNLDSHLESLQKIVEGVHQYGAKISVQLTAGFGRVVEVHSQRLGIPPISASTTHCYFNPETTTRTLSTQEVEKLAQAFGTAAKRCKMAGVDAIEFHGHEGYLLDQFMSKLWNQRNDKYGGNRKKRLTFVREAIAAIRKVVAKDLVLIYRFGIKHYLEGGRTLEESLLIAKQLESMGFDALHVDAGCYETNWWPHPPTYQPPGCMVDLAQKVKHAVKVPIITVGKLQYPTLAENVLQENKADFVAIGRGLLADPDWPNKVIEGRLEDIRPCIGDHDGCLAELRAGKATSCTVNPACGHEKEWALTPIKDKKKVLIVGGGPAGMEAARVAALRKLEVTLWEKSSRLGGNLWPASVPEFKKDLRDLINYQATQLRKQPVKIELNREATTDEIVNFGADSVILATGAVQEFFYIPGINRHEFITAVALLLDKTKVGRSVLVMGGGLIGCETAVYLAQKGHQVTLTSRRANILTDVGFANRDMLLKMMTDYNVHVLSNCWPVRIVTGGIFVKHKDQERTLLAESLISAAKMRSRNELTKVLSGKVKELYAIGDCVEPRSVINAIWEGFHTARKI